MNATLIDRDPLPLQRAARRNEGKIHLGLVYAGESDARTAALMLEGALSFGPIVRCWIGHDAWRRLAISTPYHYLVHRDSLLPAPRLRRHYAAVQRLYEHTLNGLPPGAVADYLGESPASLWRPLQPGELAAYRGAPVLTGFATAERAIDPAGLCDAISHRLLHDPAITWLGDTTVEAVEPAGDALRIMGRRGGDTWASRQAVVVNATWDSRLAIDRTMGLPAPASHLLRLKYRVLVALPEGLRGWSDEVRAPACWEGPCLGRPDPEEARRIAEGTLRELDPFLPGLAGSQVLQVDAGVIVARGTSDVDDPSSGLHSRTAIGLLHHGADSYFSVDPGKWTTAPLFARRIASVLTEQRREASVG